MQVRVSALHTSRALLLRNIIILMLLVLISVKSSFLLFQKFVQRHRKVSRSIIVA
jgi:hypothetical protein